VHKTSLLILSFCIQELNVNVASASCLHETCFTLHSRPQSTV